MENTKKGSQLPAKNSKTGAKKASDKKLPLPADLLPIEGEENSKAGASDEKLPSPADLLPIGGEEKGDVFFDTQGNAVGYENDFFLNKCTVTKSGWILLAGVSPELVEPGPSSSGYNREEEKMDDNTDNDSDKPQSTLAVRKKKFPNSGKKMTKK
ncbi:hypothetical protein TNCT_657901 [Trichonephila clavata]|uniref:Uncharacterized protein n=1 Tax=Trichonephila clavata TaxID=2740835 RepID=A0A8X6J274_TRICU|nr:hypothetical protein TNCT_657901 [Trichonephila clavata]